MTTLILDLDQFTSETEATTINRCGFKFIRLTRDELPAFEPPVSPANVILRSERMEKAEYETLFTTLSSKGLTLINSPDMSERASEFSLQYPLIRSSSPRSLIVPSDTPADKIMQQIETEGLRFPLFLKTERKSLKEKSLVTESSTFAIEATVGALNSTLGPFKSLVIKEVLSLDPDDSRGIVFKNSLIAFDTGPLVGEKTFQHSGIYHFFYRWMASMASHDFANFFVMDVTRVNGVDDYVIVEIKDAQFTKIKNPDIFWPKLANLV